MSKLFSHPREPVVTSFVLIATGTGWYDIRCDVFAAQAARMNVIKSKFM
jgi:hypothetical protein